MKRLGASATRTVALALLMVLGPVAGAHAASTWRFEPAVAPPPPTGVAPAPYGVPVGRVGQISFWAPNRGLLISGGSTAVPAGLYAYDGVTWHQLATVCGGDEGRIAWAGPDEFWTISDQRPGQVVSGHQVSLRSLSLCHFLNGQVVGSYAMPLEQSDSYPPMDAAACYESNDCWFGGVDGSGPNSGAFHLHWDGSTVTAGYGPEDHSVTGMISFAGQIYESVQIGGSDTYLASENQQHPAVLHRIAPAAQGGADSDLFMFSGVALPNYGVGVLPDALQGFSLADDGPPLGSGATQLWAAANPLAQAPAGSHPGVLTVLRLANGHWSQLLPSPEGVPPSTLPSTALLAGSSGEEGYAGSEQAEQGTTDALAPEPGSSNAWLSLTLPNGQGASVALLEASGAVAETDTLPGPQDPVGLRGGAGPITCPAPHDCWMATNEAAGSAGGWLFHLSEGATFPQDTDPNFAGVISFRPPDASVPVIYPDVPPLDNSLANQQPPPPPAAPAKPAATAPVRKKSAKALLTKVHSEFLHHRVLVVSFTLTARAHVQLLARRRSRVVAKTPRESLRSGRHRLSLSLDPKHWPTKLQFEAQPLGAPQAGGESGGGSNSSDTVGT